MNLREQEVYSDPRHTRASWTISLAIRHGQIPFSNLFYYEERSVFDDFVIAR